MTSSAPAARSSRSTSRRPSERTYPDQVVARLVQDDRASYQRIAELRQRVPVRRAQHPARVRPVRRRRRRVDPRPHRRRHQAGRHLAAHRAARADARALTRRARDLRDVERDRRAVRNRPRNFDRPLRRRAGEDPRDPPRRSRTCRSARPPTASAALGFAGRTTISTFGSSAAARAWSTRSTRCGAVVDSRIPRRCISSSAKRIRSSAATKANRTAASSRRASPPTALADNVKLVDKYLDFDELLDVSRRERRLPHALPQPGADRQRDARVRGRLRQGDRLDALPLRPRAARARPRLSRAVPRRRRRSRPRWSRCSTTPRCARRTERRAYKFGRRMTWPNVAQAYGRSFAELLPTSRREALATSA